MLHVGITRGRQRVLVLGDRSRPSPLPRRARRHRAAAGPVPAARRAAAAAAVAPQRRAPEDRTVDPGRGRPPPQGPRRLRGRGRRARRRRGAPRPRRRRLVRRPLRRAGPASTASPRTLGPAGLAAGRRRRHGAAGLAQRALEGRRGAGLRRPVRQAPRGHRRAPPGRPRRAAGAARASARPSSRPTATRSSRSSARAVTGGRWIQDDRRAWEPSIRSVRSSEHRRHDTSPRGTPWPSSTAPCGPHRSATWSGSRPTSGTGRAVSASPAAALTRRDVVDHLPESPTARPRRGRLRVGIEQEWHTYCLADPERHLRPEEVAGRGRRPAERSRAAAASRSSRAARSSWPPPPLAPWWRGARRAARRRRRGARVAGRGRASPSLGGGRRPVPRAGAHAAPAALRRDGGVLRPLAARRAPDDVGLARRSRSTSTTARPTTSDRRWHLAHHIGPALAAAFACSPDRDAPLRRASAMWSRHRPHPHALGAARPACSATTGPSYVLDAQLMLLHDDHDRCRPMDEPTHASASGSSRASPAAGPTFDDLPTTAPRCSRRCGPAGWLELRWLDSLPAGLAETAVAAIVGAAHRRGGGRPGRRGPCAASPTLWDRGRRAGPRPRRAWPPPRSPRCCATRRVALDRTPGRGGATPRPSPTPAERWPARGRCPADDLEERLRRGAGIVDLADPPGEVHRWR